jgi:peptide/nickel transport system permease protein
MAVVGLRTGLSGVRRRVPGGLAGQLLRRPLGAAALLVTVLVFSGAALAPVVAPFDPEAIHSDHVLSPPGWPFIMGTDDFGRDIFSRVVYGGRVSLVVGLAAVGLGVGLGAAVGLVSGYLGGWFDLLVQRVIDALMSLPTLILALAIVAMLGTSVRNVILAVGIALVPGTARVVRSVALGIKEEPFVEAARVVGCTHRRIILRHLLPNAFGPLMVVATASLGSAVVAEAALSFLGLGTPPPTPSWGQMMTGSARTYIVTAPWLAFFPGLVLSLVVLAINLLGDTLRDILDPRLRSR